tara:strand:- start:1688 stop:1897 length:210 start_codon:yes stop_codon:yes gene_type:complete
MVDTSYNDDWIKKQEDGHPVLCVPRPEGALLVIGSRQAINEMSPKQQAQLGIELIQIALQRLDDVQTDT